MANPEFCQCEVYETCSRCRPISAPTITVMGGTKLTLEEAKNALQEAMVIIECVGTTGIHNKYPKANVWMKKYFPNWAD